MFSKILTSTLVKRIATLISGTVGANLIVLLATPVLSRLYAPEHFGMLALFVSISAIMGSVMCLRYEQAVYLPDSDLSARRLTLGAAGIGVALTLLLTTACGIWLLAGLTSPLGSYILLLPIAGLGLALYNLLSNWSVRMGDVKSVVKTRISRAAAQVLSQFAFAVSGFLNVGLIAGDLIGRFAGIINILRRLLSPNTARIDLQSTLSLIYKTLSDYWRFPAISAPSALLNVAVMQSPSILLATLYSPAAAGLYFMAQRVIAAPMALVGQSVAQGYTAELSTRINQGSPHASHLYFRAVGWLAAIGTPLLVGIGLVAPSLMPELLGTDWQAAGEFILVLTPFFIGQFVMSPLSTTLNLLHKQHWLLLWDLVRISWVVPAFILASNAGWEEPDTLLLFSCLMGASYIVLFLLIWSALRNARNDEKF